LGLTDVLFGRKKLKGPARDRLFALTTAAVTLNVECGLKPSGAGAVVFKPLSAGDFTRVESDVEQLVQKVAADNGSKLDRKSDTLGFEWVIVRDPELEDQVTAVYGLANGLTEQGFGEQLLAAAFRFDGGDHPVYWIYGFKTGTYWPFVRSDATHIGPGSTFASENDGVRLNLFWPSEGSVNVGVQSRSLR